MDEVFDFLVGSSYAIEFFPFNFISDSSPDDLPGDGACARAARSRAHFAVVTPTEQYHLFQHNSLVFTLGYVATLCTCMPLGFLNLDVGQLLSMHSLC